MSFKTVAKNINKNGYFVGSTTLPKTYYIHFVNNKYVCLPKIKGACVFDKEGATTFAAAQQTPFEIIAVGKALPNTN